MRTKYFSHYKLYNIPPVGRYIDSEGLRRYTYEIHPPGTPMDVRNAYNPPSITTMLATRHDPELTKWIDRVGAQEANRQRSVAAAQGTPFHAACEAYLKNEENFPEAASMPNIIDLFRRVQPELDQIETVYHQEVPLFGLIRKSYQHSNGLTSTEEYPIAGTPDCIGRFYGVNSIIDFKNSTRPKTKDQIYNYFIQITAYKEMYYYMTGIDIPGFAIIIACEELPNAQLFVGKCDDYKDDLINFVENYYLTHK